MLLQALLNPRQARWLVFFSRFRFNISYCPGSRNTKADALSRVYQNTDEEERSQIPENILPPHVQVFSIHWAIDEEIEKALEHIPVPEHCPAEKIYVPIEFRNRLITWAHSSLSAGHPGEICTQQLLSNRYWLESMNKDIHTFVASCSTC